MSVRTRQLREASRQLARHLVGSSAAIESVRRLVAQVAPSEASVLILGESGTGKEVIAQGIHRGSRRAEGPFVPVNCGAIPGELLESELFGHEKGAFTGAISTRQGRFELAAGGTLFLDEIGDMPLPMQVKLLRVLQERRFERVGSNRTQRCDVRVIAATHQDLERRVEAGDFRTDLFYRLNVFPIDVPPLRERVEDIPALVRRFVELMQGEGRGSVAIGDQAMACLMTYRWPGNVRELSNLVERLAILYPEAPVAARDLPPKFASQAPRIPRGGGPAADGGAAPEQAPASSAEAPGGAASAGESAPTRPMTEVLCAEPYTETHPDPYTQTHTAPHTRADSRQVSPVSGADSHTHTDPHALLTPVLPERGIDLKAHLADLERAFMLQALKQSDWVVARAAKLLNLQRTTLVEKMRKYDLYRP